MRPPEGFELRECNSTQDELRAHALAGAREGTWVSAEKQISGRGRRGRSWISEEGGLYLSILFRPKDPKTLTWMPLAAGIAIVEALREKGIEGVRVKWPNDLWDPRGKVGGILCEGVSGPSGAFVLAGIGINCGHAPEVPDQPASFLPLSSEQARALVLSAWKGLFDFDSGKTSSLAERMNSVSLHPVGTKIRIGGSEEVQVLGLGPLGELRVCDGTGNERLLLTEEIGVSI